MKKGETNMSSCNVEDLKQIEDKIKEQPIGITELLRMPLDIPAYQRPYKWTHKNVLELLCDMLEAAEISKKHNSFKYRVGTVILHKVKYEDNGEEKTRYYIVDGQQRVLSLVLIMLCLDKNFNCSLLEQSFDSKITQRNLHDNYAAVVEYLSADDGLRDSLRNALDDVIEAVVICVENVSEAFQLFDSQNTRGRALDPHDLLKAYHLREMTNEYEMRRAVTDWEAVRSSEIRDLFDMYLFRIRNWSSCKKSHRFTARDIDCYKGISESSDYTYAKRAGKAMPHYQITAPFLAGGSFFEMVEHYLELLSDIKTEIAERFPAISDALGESEYRSSGFCHARNLFYCALLCYYDKFRNFDRRAVNKLFLWAFMLRLDMTNLGFDSVNKYAIGEEGDHYTNKIKMFALIHEARLHTDISNLQIKIKVTEASSDQSNGQVEKEKKKISEAFGKINGKGGNDDGSNN